jgi:hypothetical protein
MLAKNHLEIWGWLEMWRSTPSPFFLFLTRGSPQKRLNNTLKECLARRIKQEDQRASHISTPSPHPQLIRKKMTEPRRQFRARARDRDRDRKGPDA